MLLGDMGADVVKVEHPTRGDETRAWGPPFAGGESAYFLAVNRNKRSVALDLKQPDDARKCRQLAARADVVVENFMTGKLDQYGLGYEQLKEDNPRLIYASITGFGPDGPYAARPGYDLLVSAVGGLMGITGTAGGEPVKVGVAITDVTTGLFVQGSICAALYARERTGRGQKIDTSLLEAQVAALVNVGSSYLVGGVEGERRGTAHESIVPYQSFRTADGHVVVAVGNEHHFARLCALLGLPELADDPRFQGNPNRVAHRTELVQLLQDAFEAKTTGEWLDIIPWDALPIGPINSLSQVFSDPQVQHREMVATVDHPTAGKVKMAGLPVKLSDTKCSIRLPPPTLGQHTQEVLDEWL